MSAEEFSDWLKRLQDGDPRAAQSVWDEYFHKLVGLARAKLGDLPRRASDEEDLALSAMKSFFRGAAAGRFSQLGGNEELWRLLATIATRKVASERDRCLAQKRGGGKVGGESAIVWGDREPGIQAAESPDPSPEMAAQMTETCLRALELLGDDRTRAIAIDKLKGYSIREIAERQAVSEQTVHRKLTLIRERWAQEFSA